MNDILGLIKKYPIRGFIIILALVCALIIKISPLIMDATSSASNSSEGAAITEIEDNKVPLSNLMNYNGESDSTEK